MVLSVRSIFIHFLQDAAMTLRAIDIDDECAEDRFRREVEEVQIQSEKKSIP